RAEDEPDAGAHAASEPVEQLDAAHPGQHEVEHHDDRRVVGGCALEEAQRLAGIASTEHGVALALDGLAQEAPEERLVVDDENVGGTNVRGRSLAHDWKC